MADFDSLLAKIKSQGEKKKIETNVVTQNSDVMDQSPSDQPNKKRTRGERGGQRKRQKTARQHEKGVPLLGPRPMFSPIPGMAIPYCSPSGFVPFHTRPQIMFHNGQNSDHRPQQSSPHFRSPPPRPSRRTRIERSRADRRCTPFEAEGGVALGFNYWLSERDQIIPADIQDLIISVLTGHKIPSFLRQKDLKARCAIISVITGADQSELEGLLKTGFLKTFSSVPIRFSEHYGNKANHREASPAEKLLLWREEPSVPLKNLNGISFEEAFTKYALIFEAVHTYWKDSIIFSPEQSPEDKLNSNENTTPKEDGSTTPMEDSGQESSASAQLEGGEQGQKAEDPDTQATQKGDGSSKDSEGTPERKSKAKPRKMCHGIVRQLRSGGQGRWFIEEDGKLTIEWWNFPEDTLAINCSVSKIDAENLKFASVPMDSNNDLPRQQEEVSMEMDLTYAVPVPPEPPLMDPTKIQEMNQKKLSTCPSKKALENLCLSEALRRELGLPVDITQEDDGYIEISAPPSQELEEKQDDEEQTSSEELKNKDGIYWTSMLYEFCSQKGLPHPTWREDENERCFLLTATVAGREFKAKKWMPNKKHARHLTSRVAYVELTQLSNSEFQKTQSVQVPSKRQYLVAVDCEMSYTDAGLELTRVTLVDHQRETLYDRIVKPERPITNYNTQYSGISEKDMEGDTVSLSQVQKDLKEFIGKDTYLAGHSIDSDLRALKIIHDKIIDTSVLYLSAKSLPYKTSLKTLTKRFLGRRIQMGTDGHDSSQDACATMELVLLKANNPPTFGLPDLWETEKYPPKETIFKSLKRSLEESLKCHVIGQNFGQEPDCLWAHLCTSYQRENDPVWVCNREEERKEKAANGSAEPRCEVTVQGFASAKSMLNRALQVLEKEEAPDLVWLQLPYSSSNGSNTVIPSPESQSPQQPTPKTPNAKDQDPSQTTKWSSPEDLDQALKNLYEFAPDDCLMIVLVQPSLDPLVCAARKKIKSRWDSKSLMNGDYIAGSKNSLTKQWEEDNEEELIRHAASVLDGVVYLKCT